MKLPVTIRVPEIACWSTLYMHLQYIVDSFEDISQQIYSLRSSTTACKSMQNQEAS